MIEHEGSNSQEGREGLNLSMAFVIYTREYPFEEVLSALTKNSYVLTERPHDRETERLLSQFQPDLAVLVIEPSNESDVDLVSSVARNSNALIMVVAPGSHADGFADVLEAGADVCVRESDGVDVISAQVAALKRRKNFIPEVEDPPTTITIGDLTLDFDRRQVERGEERIPLTPTEFKIFGFLAKNAGKVVSPVEILQNIQDNTYSYREAQEVVKVHIRRIRLKIEPDPSDPKYVVNARGFGYMLKRHEQPGDEEVTKN